MMSKNKNIKKIQSNKYWTYSFLMQPASYAFPDQTMHQEKEEFHNAPFHQIFSPREKERRGLWHRVWGPLGCSWSCENAVWRDLPSFGWLLCKWVRHTLFELIRTLSFFCHNRGLHGVHKAAPQRLLQRSSSLNILNVYNMPVKYSKNKHLLCLIRACNSWTTTHGLWAASIQLAQPH